MAEPKHYWKLGMTPPQAQAYSADICGEESDNYTEVESEVTCERCLVALRDRSRPPQVEEAPSAPASVPGPIAQTGADIRYVPADLEAQIHAAVVAERLAIIHIIEKVAANKNVPRQLVPARILVEIGKRK